jgi:hypothetical protein
VKPLNALFGITLALAVAVSDAQEGDEDPVDRDPDVVQISATRYRVGPIELDTSTKRLQVPGRVLRRDPPLEYLAVTRGGLKAYESLLELDATAYEFNLACILIGLDPEASVLPEYQFDQDPVVGPRVRVEASWEAEGKTVTAHAAELLTAGGAPIDADAWAYTGSVVVPDGRYLAHFAGTLIGFVHDPASVIEHVKGLGIGNYGLIAGNAALVPVEGTPITLSVQLDQETAAAQ